jgi:hypothetical protein
VRTLISNSCGGWVGGAPEDGWLPMAAAPRALRGSLARPPVRSLLRPARGAGGACSRPTPQAQTRYDRVWAVPSSASRTEPNGLSARWRRELSSGAPRPPAPHRRPKSDDPTGSRVRPPTPKASARARDTTCAAVWVAISRSSSAVETAKETTPQQHLCAAALLSLARGPLIYAPESRTAAANPSPQSKSLHSEIMPLACVNSQRGKRFPHRQC